MSINEREKKQTNCESLNGIKCFSGHFLHFTIPLINNTLVVFQLEFLEEEKDAFAPDKRRIDDDDAQKLPLFGNG